MDNKALLDSVMLDEADYAMLAADLSKIKAMIERAAQTIGKTDAIPVKPDAAWQKIVPVSDPAAEVGGADVVPVRHEITAGSLTLPTESLTVPRIVL